MIKLILCCLLVSCVSAERSMPAKNLTRIHHQIQAKSVAIASQGHHASRAALAIAQLGGNAIDVATTLSFTLAVERPQSTGIGGGGFMLIYIAKENKVYAVDFRETAPHRATVDMFLDSKGQVITNKSTTSSSASGIPGLVAGVLEVQRRFGKLNRQQVLAPAVTLAEQGFRVYPHLAKAIAVKQKLLARYPAAADIFLKDDGTPYRQDEILRQADLALTLQRIADDGRAGFYQGTTAKQIVDFMDRHQGLIDQKDLDNYRVKWRSPIVGQLTKGLQIMSMPPPSSGGVHIVQILNILKRFSLNPKELHSANHINIIAQAMQKAFADRAKHLGDSDFVDVPLDHLLSQDYARQISEQIDQQRARPSEEVQRVDNLESDSTTHFSVIDAEGNIVSSTQTINGWFGSAIVVPDTGIVLNNEMDDFSIKIGVANIYGALGNDKNAIEAGKRPLSSMSPTIVMRNNKPILALGSPSGTRIISCVLQTIVNNFVYDTGLYQAIALPRFHHQWQPDVLWVEQNLPQTTVSELQKMGYTVERKSLGCSVQAVARIADNQLIAVSDPRGYGLATGY